MLSDPGGTVVVSSLGWVDHSSIWHFDSARGIESQLPLGDARHLSLHDGTDGFFSVVHHADGRRIEITVHAFAEPANPAARAVVIDEAWEVSGDPSVWTHVPKSYVAYHAGASGSDFALVRVDPSRRGGEIQRFDWYGGEYDKGYQGIVGVVEVPRSELLIVSVQRDSSPVVYDPVARKKVGALDLAGRLGNPTLFFRRRTNELWADDYDTMLKIEPGSWRILKSRLVEKALAGTGRFIGRFAFDADETACIVARPFSRDVVALDTRSLRIRHRCGMDGEPFEAVTLRDGSIVARDWKSGRLLRGTLGRAWTL